MGPISNLELIILLISTWIFLNLTFVRKIKAKAKTEKEHKLISRAAIFGTLVVGALLYSGNFLSENKQIFLMLGAVLVGLSVVVIRKIQHYQKNKQNNPNLKE